MLTLLKTRLLAPLYLSLVLLAAFVILRMFLNAQLSHLRGVASEQIKHTLLVQREADRLMAVAFQEQADLRNYLLTKQIANLSDFEQDRTSFESSLTILSGLMQDNPVQLEKLDDIDRLHQRWLDTFALQAVDGKPTRRDSRPVFELMRQLVSTLQWEEERLQGERDNRYQSLVRLSESTDVLGSLLILIGIGFNGWLLRRRVEQPLVAVTEVGRSWRSGKLEQRIGYRSPDEIGTLARVLDSMALELKIRQQQAEEHAQQLEDLIAALSHDLRTPLLAARATLNSLISGAYGQVSAEWQDIFREYQQTNEDLLKLVNNLLEVSRYEAGRKVLVPEILNWQNLVARVITQVKKSSATTVTIVQCLEPALPNTFGDEVEIRRVIQNLLENAVRVSPARGQVEVAVSAAHRQVRVSIRDGGPGIAASEREKLFHRFIQGRGRRGGAGLGLYLCRQIVQFHGGSIGVESTPGSGSTFWFTLPCSLEPSQTFASIETGGGER
ncbi:sensor histidine kinase [Gloeobacter kilaueensis]|uniref:histidine kinase n=1 Tax=Gloeobacter kilaueensis (strain ATCC BAA-2537 / CCAP 1431/1 / ULC 316 / JS1) TaxID=1183438 RepID=U5QNP5_GLOK1|nr:ATP-binding protein [Gloeobacter kilaueensis]AGY59219.1 two-component sensor histidine kinase [Gloeobacter kilaueensis JS1]